VSKPASEVMQNVIIAAVTEAIEALKSGAKGLPNNLLRDIQSVHPNAHFDELPKGLQDSINLSVRSAFNQLLKEGYAVGPKSEMQSRPMDRVPERPRSGPGGERRGPADRRFVRKGEGRRGPGGPGRGPAKGPRPGGGAPKK
jgi:hypothetical protein